MNHTTDGVSKFLKSCQFNFGQQMEIVIGFPSNTLYWNFIVVCAVNIFIGITSLFLNGTILMTFRRSPRLRDSVPIFLVMLQSSVDFGGGMIATPFMISGLVTLIAGAGRCWLDLGTARVGMTALIFSIIILSAMNIERYMGIVHPMIHRTKVTKRKLLIYVISVSLFYLITFAVSFVNFTVFAISTSLIMVTFLSMTVFVYIRIFFAASKSGMISDSDVSTDSSRNMSNERTRRAFSKQIKLAKSCFLVVVCFFVCYMPILIVNILNTDGFKRKVLILWAGTIALMNPIFNSIIFFWKDNMLRKEAKITLKMICGSK